MLAPLRFLLVSILGTLLAFASIAAVSDPVPAGRLLPLVVQQGRCEFVLPPSDRGEHKYHLIVGAVAVAKGPFHIVIRTDATDSTTPLPLLDTKPTADWRQRTDALADRLARFRKERQDDPAVVPTAEPPQRRKFFLFVSEGEFQNPASYDEVRAELRGVGKHCQVYVDCEHGDRDALQPTVDDAVKTFDESVFPMARKSLGRCLDVDRDGRFTILFSPKLARMSCGKVRLEGFVRGADFFRDQAAPFGNCCDLLYLNTDLKPGNYLRTILAHEYTHAVIFSEHVFGEYLPAKSPVDEESWLNEAIAHLVEDMHGYSWANLDYRVAAFLDAPEKYALVVPDYYAAKVWRSGGHRGAAYLFLRWCVDTYGVDVAGRLVQSNLCGVGNLEAATREPFANLFREWTAALAVGGLGIKVEGVRPIRRIDLHGTLGDKQLTGPQFHDLPAEVDLSETSAAYFKLRLSTKAGTRIWIEGPPEAGLQVSLICPP
jgi:hypothetical protein